MECEFRLCLFCGYIFNALFDRQKMHEAYKNASYITPKNISSAMSSHILTLAQGIRAHKNSSQVCLEIAPGSCDLLVALRDDFDFFYTIDPSKTPKRLLKDWENLFHYEGFFSYEAVPKTLKIDLIICRHLIEHIDEPLPFLKDMAVLLEEGGMIYIETPNAREILTALRFYELRHEHCGYWDEIVLQNIMADLGFYLVEALSFYDGQWFGHFYKKQGKSLAKRSPFLWKAKVLKKALEANIAKLESALKPFRSVALYGAGGHANSLITYLSQESCAKIKIAIDKDERRVGTFLQNSDIEIKAPHPSNLKDIDCILMVMPCYEKIVFEKELRHFEGKVILSAKGVELLP